MLACVLTVLDDFNTVSRILRRTSMCYDWVFLVEFTLYPWTILHYGHTYWKTILTTAYHILF